MSMNRYIKQFEILVRNSTRKIFQKKDNLNSDQKIAISIIKKSIVNEKSQLVAAPMSNRKFVHLNDVFITINETLIEIVNGKYSYEIEIPESQMNNIKKCFNRTLERRIHTWERTITNKRAKSLSDILETLS